MHPHSERGGVLGSLLLVLGILVLITMVAIVAGGLYVAKHVHVTAAEGKHGDTVSVETPFGSLRVSENSKLDPKRLGVPMYPVATVRDDRHNGASVELNFGSDNAKELAVVAGQYVTPDPIDKVREFYRGELPHWMISEDRHGAVHFSFTEGGHKRIVILQRRGDETKIALVSVGAPAAN